MFGKTRKNQATLAAILIWCMEVRGFWSRVILTVACVVGMFFPVTGYTSASGWSERILYSFSHANVWHLLCNLSCLWLFRFHPRVLMGLLVSVCVTCLPCMVVDWHLHIVELPVCGLSVCLFAMIGIHCAEYGHTLDGAKKVLPFVLLTGIIPHVAGLAHLWGYLVGTLAGMIKRSVKRKILCKT